MAGGLVLVRASGVERYLRYFVALGAGFLMATALLEMVPEGLRLSPRLGPVLIMAGYCVVHLLEHTINAHFHYGEETHTGEFVSRRTGYSVLGGLSVHALFDGVAIGSGFVVSNWLGWLIFLAILLHKAPEGFTMATVMLASGRSRRHRRGSLPGGHRWRSARYSWAQMHHRPAASRAPPDRSHWLARFLLPPSARLAASIPPPPDAGAPPVPGLPAGALGGEPHSAWRPVAASGPSSVPRPASGTPPAAPPV